MKDNYIREERMKCNEGDRIECRQKVNMRRGKGGGRVRVGGGILCREKSLGREERS